mmetsp:Transcript_854/g.2419  ORF Transcript_854/g.2419 Transcript_854/m.2419 type:complete len:90 (-) Transcript_854:734-1003(-)
MPCLCCKLSAHPLVFAANNDELRATWEARCKLLSDNVGQSTEAADTVSAAHEQHKRLSGVRSELSAEGRFSDGLPAEHGMDGQPVHAEL